MESDQTDQVQKIWGMDSKDFPCSSKRILLCPADDFLFRPEMGEKSENNYNRKKVRKQKNIFKLHNLNVLRLKTQTYPYLAPRAPGF